MDLAGMRTVLRRQVQDVDGVQWSDAECNQALNEGYYQLQSEVHSVDPENNVTWDYEDSTADTSWYPLPPSFGIISVGLKGASDTTYTKLQHKLYEDIKDLTGTTTYYTRRGEWIGIFPAPDATVSNGIELIHKQIHTLTDDTDLPKLKLPLHYGIVLAAKIWLLGDTNEQSEQDERKLQTLINRIAKWYGQDYDEAVSFSPRGL